MATKSINLKLKQAVLASATLARLSQIPGVMKIERLFPEETDPELTTLYIVTAELSSTDSVVEWLSTDQDVEFAEIPPPRKLM